MKSTLEKAKNRLASPPKHPVRARAIVALIMLALAFSGLVVTDLHRDGGWLYWRIIAAMFAALCLGLSGYVRRTSEAIKPISIWHELLHWIGLAGSIYLVYFYVTLGIMGRFEAGLMVLTLLALTTFLIGIYVEYFFMLIGVMLGGFAAGAAFAAEYLYTVMLPITIVIGIGLYFMIHRRKKRPPESL